jgi:hypothetical protein
VKLITAHRILILAAIAFFVFYAAFLARRYLETGGVGHLVQGGVSALVVVGLVVYYRTLKGWGERL